MAQGCDVLENVMECFMEAFRSNNPVGQPFQWALKPMVIKLIGHKALSQGHMQ